MSRIGNKPVALPSGVEVIVAENNLQVGVAIPFIPGFIDFLLTYNLSYCEGT